MTAYTKVSGAWRTVSQPYFKLAGAWKSASAMAVRVGWPNRYPSTPIPPTLLSTPGRWGAPQYNSLYDPTQPVPTVEGPSLRMTWAIDVGKLGLIGASVQYRTGVTYTVTVTCTAAPAGVQWRARIENRASGNWVTGPGTSTIVYTEVTGSYAMTTGIETEQPASGTAGHLMSVFTVTTSGTPAAGANDFVPNPWKQVWPTPGVGAPGIVGVRKQAADVGTYYTAVEAIQYRADLTHFLDGQFTLPLVPYYAVKGDPSTIASAKVTLRFTPNAPKSPVEQTISWEAPVGWALYHIAYVGTDGNYKWYYAALTDAEAATVRGTANRYVTKMWSPREGGWFVWMPVCWDISGATVPMRAESVDNTAWGTDAHSGYASFPPNVAASSTITADYTVSHGYSDMAYSGIAYSAITIELKNSGGTVISSWTGSLAGGAFPDEPGKKVAVTPPAVLAARRMEAERVPYYWPVEWRGLFDNLDKFGQAYKVVWGRDIPNKGAGEWDVLDRDGVKIGDFRLALRYGPFPGVIEIAAVNLEPDLIGLGIMRTIVEHGVEFSPTEDIIVMTQDDVTKAAMMSWGWQEMSTLSVLSLGVLPLEYRERLSRCLFIWSNPMYNRFSELGFPSWQEVHR